MADNKKKPFDFILYCLILGLIKILRLFPLSLDLYLGHFLSILWFYIDKRHRTITLENLEMAFGQEITPGQRLILAKRVFCHFGRVLMECIFVPSFTPQNISQYVSVTGIEHLKEAEKKGKGILFLTGHFANWELLGAAFALHGFVSGIVARPLDNPYFNQLSQRYRTRFGNWVIPKKGAVKEIIKCMRKNQRVAILIDQNASANEGVFVDFFGIPACTTHILATLAQKTGAVIIPLFLVPQKNGHGYLVEVNPAVDLIVTGQKEMDLIVNTERFTQIIEKYIRKYPQCWFWMHRRWKTRPESQLKEWGRIRQVKKDEGTKSEGSGKTAYQAREDSTYPDPCYQLGR